MTRNNSIARLALFVFAAVVATTTPARGQNAQRRVQAAELKKHLYIIASDSLGGRDTGSRGNYRAAEYVAARFKAAGLEPGGENGTYFQTVPFVHTYLDPVSTFTFRSGTLRPGFEYMPVFLADGSVDHAPVIFGGVASDTSTWITAEQAANAFVVFKAAADVTARTSNAALNTVSRNPRLRDAAGVALIALDLLPVDQRGQRLQGRFSTIAPSTPGNPAPAQPPAATPQRPTLLLTARAASQLFGADVASLQTGMKGDAITGAVRVRREPLEYAARNVVAILRGADPVGRNTFMALTAHNDHVGFVYTGADHDSVYAYNRVVRPMGADTPDRTATAEEWTRIKSIRDSLHRIRPGVRDSIYNGADDDGSGTVALIEVARTLAAGPRPARSIIFVNHTAEERGLVGSSWFATYPTVERDSIVGEMDMDMIGRGNVSDLPAGGTGYLEVVGAKRLSREYGEILEQVNAIQPTPFNFNYEFDAPGHPLQYYCRADHYSYARWGIPAFAVSRGEHADYHQVTDEAEYIDYNNLARVANLAMDFARTIANMEHRPKLDAPKTDPNTQCRQ